MSNRKRVLIGVALAAACAAVAVVVKQYRWHFWPKRFAVVEPGKLYRGGFPEPGPLAHLIDEYRIRTIVNLAEDPPDQPTSSRVLSEKRIARQKGVAYHSFRLPGDGLGEFDTLERAAALLADADNYPVFFHCAGGRNRTNAVLAVLRMKYQGWTLEQALKEIEKFGLNRRRHHRLVAHLRRYYRQRVAGVPASRPTASGDLASMFPADTLFLYQTRPLPSQSDNRDLLWLLKGVGLLHLAPDQGGVFLDVVSSMTVLGRFPYAVGIMTLDVQPRQVPGSFKLKRMRAALLVRTGGDDTPVISQVDGIVKNYASTQTAQILERKVGAYSFQVLRDHRVPAWCETQFGRIGEVYAIGFGAGTLEAVCAVLDHRRPALQADDWYERAGSKVRAAEAYYQVYGNLEGLRRRLEPVLAGRPQKVADALELGSLLRFRWALGFQDAGHRSLLWMHRREGDTLLPLSDPADFPDEQVAVIPKRATGYAITRLDVPWLGTHLSQALLASLRPDKAEALRRWWADMERENSLDSQRDLLDHLGPYLIVHNYPAHPGKVPFMCTILLQHDGSSVVRTYVERFLSAWKRRLDEQAKRHPDRALAWRWDRDPADGIWFVHAGLLAGHALAVTDRYIILSWSRQAVRLNLPYLDTR